MSLKRSLLDLYGTMNRPTQHRMWAAFVGMLVSAGLDVAGLALVLPLMQAMTLPEGGSPTGVLATVFDLLGDPSRATVLVFLAAVIFGLFLLKGVYSLCFYWWVLGVNNRQKAAAATDMFGRYLNADYTFHLRRNSAEILRTVTNAMNQAYLDAVNATLQFCTEAVTAVAILVLLIVVRPVPALAAILYFALMGFGINRLMDRRSSVAGVELMEAASETNKAALQGLGGIKEVYVRRVAAHFVKRFEATQHRLADALRVQQFFNVAPRYAIEMLFVLGIAIMSIVVFATGSSTQSAATLALFVAAGFKLLPSLSRMVAAAAGLRMSQSAISLVVADVDALAGVEASDVASPPIAIHDRLSIEKVSYRYPGSDHDVLRDVSFDAPVGTSVALVGASGAGKTTLVDVVLGLLTPTEGGIRVDGRDLDGDLEAWQRSIGLVPQDVYLFDDTLRANIVFGEHPERVDDDRLTEAINRAQLDGIVDDLEDGLDTVVGERGVRLSGGQRQRIGIARALYLRPRLLVLDEATSALDNITERQITSTIESLHGQVTMIVVAHRLSTVRRCDKLIFMADGRIETTGTFEEVRNANETFASLVRLGSLESLEDPGDEGPGDIDGVASVSG